jgi:hypothetical protein
MMRKTAQEMPTTSLELYSGMFFSFHFYYYYNNPFLGTTNSNLAPKVPYDEGNKPSCPRCVTGLNY